MRGTPERSTVVVKYASSDGELLRRKDANIASVAMLTMDGSKTSVACQIKEP